MYVVTTVAADTRLNRVTADASDHNPLLGDLDVLGGHIPLPGQPGAANAAVALTQLHQWESDFVSSSRITMSLEGLTYGVQDVYSDADLLKRDVSGYDLPSLRAQFDEDTLPAFQTGRRELLPSILQSPTNRYSSLPPVQRREKPSRPRKPSMGENARKGKHERGKSSKEFSAKELSHRLNLEGRVKALSAEPPTASLWQRNRWEDLIEAATSVATEADDDRDLTPVSQMTFFDCPLFTCCCQELELL
jgi:hypothetical protein